VIVFVLLLPELLSPVWEGVPVDDEIEEITVVAVTRTCGIDEVSDVGSYLASVNCTMLSVHPDPNGDVCEDVETDSPYRGDACSSPGDCGSILCPLALSNEFGLSRSFILLYQPVVVSRFRDTIQDKHSLE
jgi:hypothetical protein